MSEKRTLLATNRFKKDVADLPQEVHRRIDKALGRLVSDPLPESLDIKKLKGRSDTVFRVRVGDYRFTYSFDTENIYLREISHRKDVYK